MRYLKNDETGVLGRLTFTVNGSHRTWYLQGRVSNVRGNFALHHGVPRRVLEIFGKSAIHVLDDPVSDMKGFHEYQSAHALSWGVSFIESHLALRKLFGL